jgi:hypothetical protein
MRRRLITIALKYAIWRVQDNQEGLKLKGTHQLLPFADDVNTQETLVYPGLINRGSFSSPPLTNTPAKNWRAPL